MAKHESRKEKGAAGDALPITITATPAAAAGAQGEAKMKRIYTRMGIARLVPDRG